MSSTWDHSSKMHQQDPTVVYDADEPALKEKATQWDQLTAPVPVPGMQPEMVVLADLLGRTDPFLTNIINAKLEARSLAPVAHVSHLFMRMNNKYMCVAEGMETLAVVKGLPHSFGASEAAPQQLQTVMAWWAKRVALAYPLGGMGPLNEDALADLEQSIEHDEAYTAVRDAAKLLVRAARQLLTK
eukprot:CAMPEP_0202896600 /NCGR_PEP_ID=MMETSP1392-20130828/5580_1 /ASSEMBLY_ACC=CAM_ASM_000868 /TAXON_ID=225041 /ORGANISM="Chlamydomonas chlamydogama, Strain SAG 11-48b" /LENGTH=185 /DNA_ID=CAMNT_0049582017 /DNA_START=262 /DNA_END=820 /DNA_ORIENTATION=+